MNSSWFWGVVGVLLALLGLGIPIGYGIKLLLQKILALLENVNTLILSVQKTVNTVNGTVDKMASFIDRNDQQHNEIRMKIDTEFDRVNDNLNNQANRIVDATRR